LPISIHVHILSVLNSCTVRRLMEESKLYGSLAVSQDNLGLEQIAQPTDGVFAYWVQCFDRLVDDMQNLEEFQKLAIVRGERSEAADIQRRRVHSAQEIEIAITKTVKDFRAAIESTCC
jgi:hypothetical protein